MLALASVVPLYLGLRASEVLRRKVRDVDAGGALRWIDSGKTKHARRHLKVEAKKLQERLVSLTIEHLPEAPLLGYGAMGKPRHYAQPEALANARSARVIDILRMEGTSDLGAQLSPEQIIERLPPATLAKLAEILHKTLPGASRKDPVAI